MSPARLSAAQREQTARAAQRRRFKRKPAGRCTFVTVPSTPSLLFAVPAARVHGCTCRRTTLGASDTPTRLAAARHAPEGPRAAPSCDGLAAPLAPSGWGEHGHNVLSTPATRLEVESSVRAVVMRARLWLVAERNGRTARTARASGEPAGGVRERPPVLTTAASGQAKHHPV